MTEEHEFQEIKDRLLPHIPRGTRVDGYVIGKRLSKHPVYAARRKGTNEKFVIKQSVPYDRKDGEDPIKIGNLCLLYETELQKRCAHTNVCPVADAFAHQGIMYIVTPRLGTHNLADLKRKTSPLEKLVILESAAQALAHCHGKNVVHLDVKPGNFIAEEKTTLIDFGSALVMGEKHPYKSEGVCEGTVHSIAPEYLRFNIYSPRSDTFSFSLMAYRMLTNHEPYGGTENGFLYYDLPLFRPEKLDMYTEIKDLIVRGMSTTVSQRPDMKEIADSFKEQTAKYHRQPSAKPSTPCLVSS